MRLWFDAHLSPSVAKWTIERFGVDASSLRELGLRQASDLEVFEAASREGAIVVTKDADFARLSDVFGGPPPSILWLTFGNTSNAALRAKLEMNLEPALAHFQAGARLVEVR